MKTLEQINEARAKLAKIISEQNLSNQQLTNISGMLIALVWAADGRHSSTMDRLLAGEAIVPRKHDVPFHRVP